MSVYSVSVYPGSVTIRKGEWYYGAYATVRASSYCSTDVRWYSNNTNVATVNAATGYIYARSAGTARIYAQSKVDSSKWDYITVNVTNGNICVDSVCLNYSYLSLEKGDRRDLSATVCPANATNKSISWSSSNNSVARVNPDSGYVTAQGAGTATITATVQENAAISDSCIIWCDEFLYRLVNELRFAEDDAKLIRSLYDKVEEKYNTETRLYRAWMSSRLMGGICYGNETSGMNAQFKWNDVAGRVFLGSEEDYFVNTLGFTSAEYKQLVNSIKRQYADTDTPDFVHMQISLAARLAYKLNLDGILSNLGTFCSDETVSYLAGWLGDATITNSNGLTSFGNDDYCADLDAENIYRAIMSNNKRTIIDATNIYYDSLNSQNLRADVFLGYISIDDVKQKNFARFGIAKENNPMNIIKNSYPDTYNFICSLSDSLEHIMNY